jgi:hypothetical protein
MAPGFKAVTPEPLFHDEEIASFGVHNPLWHDDCDFDLFSKGLDQDPLILQKAVIYQPIIPRKRPFRQRPAKRGCDQCCVVSLLLLAAFILAVTLTRDDDPATTGGATSVVPQLLFSCPALGNNESFSDYLETILENRTSFCDENFADNCTCESHLRSTHDAVGVPEQWKHRVDRNEDFMNATTKELDVVLLGDSLVEQCAGGLLEVSDNNLDLDRSGMAAVCHQLFRRESGGRIEGLALGVEGDRVSGVALT